MIFLLLHQCLGRLSSNSGWYAVKSHSFRRLCCRGVPATMLRTYVSSEWSSVHRGSDNSLVASHHWIGANERPSLKTEYKAAYSTYVYLRGSSSGEFDLRNFVCISSDIIPEYSDAHHYQYLLEIYAQHTTLK